MIRQLCKKIVHRLKKTAGDPVLKGLQNGSRAFCGPEIVQFDLTNRCNNNCLCCWNNSPLLGELSGEERQKRNFELPFSLVKETIRHLKRMGTKTLFLAGGGEPFMHPRIMDILRFVKACGMKIFINTNFTLIDEEMAKEIVDCKIDMIHVSLLAGSAKTYAAIHPNKSEATFGRIIDVLRYLLSYRAYKKQQAPTPLPHVDLYYVICNKNYEDIQNMADLAMELKVNSLEFMPVDVVPKKTDSLLLDEKQRQYVLGQVQEQKKRLDQFNERHGGRMTFIEQYDSFIKRMSTEMVVRGAYEAATVTRQPCYVGWVFLRILANGDVTPCLKAHRIVTGNIRKQSIKDIWNSHEQRLFRKKTFHLDGRDPYFARIGNNEFQSFGCLNSCDNIQINMDMHNKFKESLTTHGRIRSFSDTER